MPAAVHADWSQVRDTAVALNSIRDAAAQHGVPYDAAKQRAKRESWPVGRRIATVLATAKASHAVAVAKANPSAVTSVTSTTDALVNQLATDSQATKIAFSTATRKVAEKVAAMKPSINKDRAQAIKHWAGVAESVHGWNEKAKPEGGLVSVTLVRLVLPEVREVGQVTDAADRATPVHAIELPG